MTFDVEHLFICLFNNCISSLLQCLFRKFALLFVCLGYLYFCCGVLRVCFAYFGQQFFIRYANVFFQCFAYLIILLIAYFIEQSILIVTKSSLSILFFMGHVFGVIPKKPLPYRGHLGFSLLLTSRNVFILL